MPSRRSRYNKARKSLASKLKNRKKKRTIANQVETLKKQVGMLKKVNEPLTILEIQNGMVPMNAESAVKIYTPLVRTEFTSKEYTGNASVAVSDIPEEAWRKGDELYCSSITFHLQLYNRQSIYRTRFMVIQFKDNHSIQRALGAHTTPAGQYSPVAQMTGNFAKWGIVGSMTGPQGQPSGRQPNLALLSMKQPVKETKDRYDAFHVLHDEVIYNKETDQVPGHGLENQSTCLATHTRRYRTD